MSSAITLVGNQQVIALTTRLIVGIRLQGTIGFIDPRNPYSIKPRPYLAYFAETLRRLHCDVTLFVPTNEDRDRDLMDNFHRRDFSVPFRYVHDHAKLVGAGSGRGNRKQGIAPNNYTEYLRIQANQVNGTGQATDRILFIDSEVNYRFTPVQTLVLDSYEPMTRRQQREIVKAQRSNPFGDVSSQRARRYAAAAAKATGHTVRHRAALHAQQLQAQLDKTEASTALLMAEQSAVPLVDPDANFSDLTRHATKREGAAATRRGVAGNCELNSGCTRSVLSNGGAGGGVRRDSRGRMAGTKSQRDAPLKDEAADAAAGGGASSGPAAGAAMSHALAINLEDYSLVAVAEMIAEMAASDVSVAEYLKLEPLVEKVEVPFHGKANYLPPENCDNIELLNWEEIKVMEKKSQNLGVPETVEETAEHKDFFQ